MKELRIKSSSFISRTELEERLKSKKPVISGVYVISPYKNPYYTGQSGSNHGVFSEINSHLNKILKVERCDFVVFKDEFYTAQPSSRNLMIPRKAEPTKPEPLFLKFAEKNVLFWRENKVGFMKSENLKNPKTPKANLINVKEPLLGKIKKIIENAFSYENFSFFYFEIEDESFGNNRCLLESLETIIKFSLKNNTVGKSKCINDISQEITQLGISKIFFQCKDDTIKSLFHGCPVDENGDTISSLQNLVQII